MKTILSNDLRSSQGRRISVSLSEAIPFWFAISSPLVGLALGVFGVWVVAWLTS